MPHKEEEECFCANNWKGRLTSGEWQSVAEK